MSDRRLMLNGSVASAAWLVVAVTVSLCAVAEAASASSTTMPVVAMARFSHDPQQRALAIWLQQIQQAVGGDALRPSAVTPQRGPQPHGDLASRVAWFVGLAPSPSWGVAETFGAAKPQQVVVFLWTNLPPPCVASFGF